MKRKDERKQVVIVVAILILVLVLIYSGLRILESTVFNMGAEPAEDGIDRTIVRDGVEYYPKLDTTIILLTGVDTEGPMVSSGAYNNEAEADMISLLIFDETNKKLDIISLNRDSMVDMPVLGIGGKPAGSRHGQLALAHTYGSGLEDSSQNLKKTVSDLLYGLQIDYYVTINMDAIAILNDAVDGVTVEVTDDFSEVDSNIPIGTVTLWGEQAKNFVQVRHHLGNQLNLNRMERHRAYMKGFMESLRSKLESDPSFMLGALEDVKDYMITDCSNNAIVNMANRYKDYTLADMISPEGENVKGKEFMEFHLDEAYLDKMILKYFYELK
ncbi:MAG: LCP family protein [Oscillospiraceae bacterium]|nr:LCP family protein [Oscillospiraceae bacterium]